MENMLPISVANYGFESFWRANLVLGLVFFGICLYFSRAQPLPQVLDDFFDVSHLMLGTGLRKCFQFQRQIMGLGATGDPLQPDAAPMQSDIAPVCPNTGPNREMQKTG